MHLQIYDTLSSTMDEARTLALQECEEGTVVVARTQTAGRGRRGRSWDSPKGNIYLTYITYQGCSLTQGLQLAFVACIAVGEALRSSLAPAHSLLYKWPNDLLLNGKKLGGLLVEQLPEPASQTAYLIGCGVNRVSFPHETRYGATSLHDEGVDTLYENLLSQVALSLEKHIALWKEKGFEPFRTLWVESMMGLGKTLTFESDTQRWQGIAQGITDDGALILSTSDGPVILHTGDVTSVF